MKISPLSFQHRSEIQGILTEAARDTDYAKASQGTFLAVKYSLKHISGVENYDGSAYELEVGEDGFLTDECVSDLLNLEISAKLGLTAVKLINGVPESILDENGKPIEGITLLYKGATKSPNLKKAKKKK